MGADEEGMRERLKVSRRELLDPKITECHGRIVKTTGDGPLGIQENPGVTPAYKLLAACYAHMARLDEARAIVAKLRAITTQVVPSELFLSGLRLAAGEAREPDPPSRCGTGPGYCRRFLPGGREILGSKLVS
jgi:adenylate cyclase